jgi:hypothetical protein
MNFKGLLGRLFPRVRESHDPISIVLLQRVPKFLTKEVLVLAAERAWHKSFQSEHEHSRYFVVQETSAASEAIGTCESRDICEGGTMAAQLAAGSQALRLTNGSETLARFLPQEAQRDAWLAHKAWVAIDCHNKDPEDEPKYCIMANLAAELLDDNTSGVYFPAKRVLAPYDDRLYLSLKQIATSRKVVID